MARSQRTAQNSFRNRQYEPADTEDLLYTQINPAPIYGTAAPQLDPEPASRPAHPAAPGKRRQAPGRRTHQLPDIGISRGYIAFLAVATIIVAIVCVSMLSIKSDLTAAQNSYEKLETQLQKQRAENDSKEIYLNKSIDLSEVYRVATEELGMVYPSNDQVIYYEHTDGGYVRQYEDIPTS